MSIIIRIVLLQTINNRKLNIHPFNEAFRITRVNLHKNKAAVFLHLNRQKRNKATEVK